MLAAVCAILLSSKGPVQSTLARLEELQSKLEQRFTIPISSWRFSQPDLPDGQRVDTDDSSWPTVAPGFTWKGEYTKVWFRTRLRIPREVGGLPVRGLTVRLDLGVDDDAELYLDGKLKEFFTWDDCHYTLLPKAEGGESYDVALHGINRPGDGQLRKAALVIDVAPELKRFLTEAHFVEKLADASDRDQAEVLRARLQASETELKFVGQPEPDIRQVRQQLGDATTVLSGVARITKKATVYYVGHAHIDMNWLWEWPETIDVCHRTWDSAMNLMDQFPDFHFVQSQPGAYLPIQQQFPQEFSRMQQAQKSGQWDTVGGLVDESDTNIPSGEGLARSLFLGQRYFKQNFGRYATTGWLPDSFGHSGQLPQLFREAGLDSFYHMRGGNGIPYSWWQSPDGTQMLKANVEPYNADVNLDQLVEPWKQISDTGALQSLVVFGVGDHGGGPTREQILTLEDYKSDPVLPNVKMVSADEYFKSLRDLPTAAGLPVIDHDLQFVNEGCYTTRADIKKALRSSENSLYTSEALSTLASLDGAPYPTQSFEDWWHATAFAQFHDIACGSAIHSTYDWMLGQLRPNLDAIRKQTATAVNQLSASVDTRGPNEHAIVVWNPLSYARSDVVRVPADGLKLFQSVVGPDGKKLPVQVSDDGSMVFIARNVPGFGHEVYFPMRSLAQSDGVTPREQANAIVVDTKLLSCRIDKSTGAISSLKLAKDGWEVFGQSRDANTFQIFADDGDAWAINYRDSGIHLTSLNASVKLVEQGPVFCKVRIERSAGNSTFRQDVTIYGALDRIDVPTQVDWHEHGKLLKLWLPIATDHPSVRSQIPYGSVERAADGQECPGQKWMDDSDVSFGSVSSPTTIYLSGQFNADSTRDFDTIGAGYPADNVPSPGTHVLGSRHIPFELATGTRSADNISCHGQRITVPDSVPGNRLYILGAAAPRGYAGIVRLTSSDGSTTVRTFQLNDWVVRSFHDNEMAIAFSRKNHAQSGDETGPKLWIATVKLPPGKLRTIQLPDEPNMHVFAMTIGTQLADHPIHGLTVLNDCKYGFDATKEAFRLTLLRSPHYPDTNPDEGIQTFTYSLYPHPSGWAESAVEQHGLSLNVPLEAAVSGNHPGSPSTSAIEVDSDHVIVGALKHSEDGEGFILRLYETQGRGGTVRLRLRKPMKIEETDILERPIAGLPIAMNGSEATIPIGHDQVLTLHVW